MHKNNKLREKKHDRTYYEINLKNCKTNLKVILRTLKDDCVNIIELLLRVWINSITSRNNWSYIRQRNIILAWRNIFTGWQIRSCLLVIPMCYKSKLFPSTWIKVYLLRTYTRSIHNEYESEYSILVSLSTFYFFAITSMKLVITISCVLC